MGVQKALRLQGKYCEVISGVHAEQLFCHKLENLHRRPVRQLQDNLNALLAKDIYLARAELGVVCADGNERLDGVVCYLGDLTVEAKCLDLTGV
jgi:hypothetical protein